MSDDRIRETRTKIYNAVRHAETWMTEAERDAFLISIHPALKALKAIETHEWANTNQHA